MRDGGKQPDALETLTLTPSYSSHVSHAIFLFIPLRYPQHKGGPAESLSSNLTYTKY